MYSYIEKSCVNNDLFFSKGNSMSMINEIRFENIKKKKKINEKKKQLFCSFISTDISIILNDNFDVL